MTEINNTKVIKRNGDIVDFNKNKIIVAIEKAMKHGVGYLETDKALEVANKLEQDVKGETVSISEIESLVFDLLCKIDRHMVAKEYEGYRKVREFQRSKSQSDDAIMSLVNGTNYEVNRENSNKDETLLSTQGDLIAGETSKDLARRKIIPTHIVQAHDNGVINFHDSDYVLRKGMFNCCLPNLQDMLQNGTVINRRMIEKPKSFQTACTVTTQIVQQIASGQYGGQSISIAHLSPFVRDSYNKYLNKVKAEGLEIGIHYSRESIEKIAKMRLKDEVSAGIQTIQYQVNTFNTNQGQSPFLSIFMYVDEDCEFKEETAMLIEEMLKQRYDGMKNEIGIKTTPSFPKLLYVLGKSNTPKDSKYRYLTDLAIKTVSKRMMPDFISEKKMMEHYGATFPCMGCRSWLSPYKQSDGELKWYGRFNQGVVSLNLVDVALTSKGNIDKFWDILDERLELCYDALIFRHNELKGSKSDISPIHWQYGGIARLKSGEVIDKYLYDGYSTLSLGFVGIHETIKYLLGESNTSTKGEKLSLDILNTMRAKCDKWKEDTNIGFALYSSPAESTVYKFATKSRDKFGIIEGVTDKDYITNSFHVNVEEEIDAFSKLDYEAQFHKISSGGCISYVEVPNLQNNLEALSEVVDYMADNIQYAEINTKSDLCHICKFDGEIALNDNLEWECPQCGNKEERKMNVCRRTCGYLGDNYWNKGRTQEIKDRYVHLDNKEFKEEDEI